jgi:hypothetical protein
LAEIRSSVSQNAKTFAAEYLLSGFPEEHQGARIEAAEDCWVRTVGGGRDSSTVHDAQQIPRAILLRFGMTNL